jgi:hypothetical protein
VTVVELSHAGAELAWEIRGATVCLFAVSVTVLIQHHMGLVRHAMGGEGRHGDASLMVGPSELRAESAEPIRNRQRP